MRESENEVLGETEESVVVGRKEKEASINSGVEQVGLVEISEGGQAGDTGEMQTEEVIEEDINNEIEQGVRWGDQVEVDGMEEEEAAEVNKTILTAKRRRKAKTTSSEAKNSKVCAEDRQTEKGVSSLQIRDAVRNMLLNLMAVKFLASPTVKKG